MHASFQKKMGGQTIVLFLVLSSTRLHQKFWMLGDEASYVWLIMFWHVVLKQSAQLVSDNKPIATYLSSSNIRNLKLTIVQWQTTESQQWTSITAQNFQFFLIMALPCN